MRNCRQKFVSSGLNCTLCAHSRIRFLLLSTRDNNRRLVAMNAVGRHLRSLARGNSVRYLQMTQIQLSVAQRSCAASLEHTCYRLWWSNVKPSTRLDSLAIFVCPVLKVQESIGEERVQVEKISRLSQSTARSLAPSSSALCTLLRGDQQLRDAGTSLPARKAAPCGRLARLR